MMITSQTQPAPNSIASTAANVATLGIGGAVRSAVEAKSERADPSAALTDMRLTGKVRELLERELQAKVAGAVVEDAKVKVRTGKLERQYTIVRVPAGEIVLLQIPGWILKDGNQIDSLDMLVYVLRGKTVRVFSPDLTGEPSSWFDGLKRNWEQDEKIYVDYVSHSRLDELEAGEGELWNVLKLAFDAASQRLEQRKPEAAVPARAERASRRIRIFLASSEELREDRDKFDLHFRQLNDQLLEEGLYLAINRWENFLDAMSETRLQDEYNKAVRACDIFVSLFFTKTGKYTEEEFDTAHQQFIASGKPFIYTFFKDADIKTGSAQQKDLESLWAFQKRLRDLGHFYTQYDSIDNLKLKFQSQLDKLLKGPLGRDEDR